MIPNFGFLNLGGQEVFIIFLIILILFGAKKLPELARGLGRSVGEFKKAKEEFDRELRTLEQQESARVETPKPGQIASDVEFKKSGTSTMGQADREVV
jgi:TatA/E family protein of Tat protein translocase